MNIKRFLTEFTSKWMDCHPTIQIVLSLAAFFCSTSYKRSVSVKER